MAVSLENKGNILAVHWIPGHRDFTGNVLADSLAKKAAKYVEGKKEDFYEGVAEKSELIKLMKKGTRGNMVVNLQKSNKGRFVVRDNFRSWEKSTQHRRQGSRVNHKPNHHWPGCFKLPKIQNRPDNIRNQRPMYDGPQWLT